MPFIRIFSPSGNVAGPTFIAQGTRPAHARFVQSFLVSPDLRNVIIGRALPRPAPQWAALFTNVPPGPWLLGACDLFDPIPTLTTKFLAIVGPSFGGVTIEYPNNECVPMSPVLAWGRSDAATIKLAEMTDSSSIPNSYPGNVLQEPGTPGSEKMWIAEFTIDGDCANQIDLDIVDSNDSATSSSFWLETCDGGCPSPP